jgi:hypothetical protein
MEPFSAETLTIVIIVTVVLAGVTLMAVLILITYLFCLNECRSRTIKPTDTPSIVYSVPIESRSSSKSPVLLKPPVIHTDQRIEQVQQLKSQKPSSDSITVTDEHPVSTYNNQKKQLKEREQHVYERDGMTTVNERRIYDQRHPQQKLFKPVKDVQFIDRQTPYPPDVLERDRIMTSHFRFPRTKKFDEK